MTIFQQNGAKPGRKHPSFQRKLDSTFFASSRLRAFAPSREKAAWFTRRREDAKKKKDGSFSLRLEFSLSACLAIEGLNEAGRNRA